MGRRPPDASGGRENRQYITRDAAMPGVGAWQSGVRTPGV